MHASQCMSAFFSPAPSLLTFFSLSALLIACHIEFDAIKMFERWKTNEVLIKSIWLKAKCKIEWNGNGYNTMNERSNLIGVEPDFVFKIGVRCVNWSLNRTQINCWWRVFGMVNIDLKPLDFYWSFVLFHLRQCGWPIWMASLPISFCWLILKTVFPVSNETLK